MRHGWRLALSFAAVSALAPSAAWAVPSNFGHPYPVPRHMLAGVVLGQYQPEDGLTAGVGGAYGLTEAQGLTFAATRGGSGLYALGLGAGHAFSFWGNYGKLGIAASQAVRAGQLPSGSVALDLARNLTDRLAIYGEVGTALAPGSPAGLRYASSVEFALFQELSVDFEYLGGFSDLGRSEILCADLALALGRAQITGTVMFPRAPEPAGPTYLIGTSWRFTP